MDPPVDLTILRVVCVYKLRASDKRTEPQAEAVIWKRANECNVDVRILIKHL